MKAWELIRNAMLNIN